MLKQFRSTAEDSLEDRIYKLPQLFYIKRKAWFGGTKLKED